MVDKFNGVFYLIIFLVHFIGVGVYAYQMIIGNQKFREKFEIDVSAATIMRMAGALFLGSFLMAIYILFVRPNGVEGTWAFFNLIFITHLLVTITNYYSKNISKLGNTDKFTNEGIIVPFVLLIMSAILCYGLSNKIYIT